MIDDRSVNTCLYHAPLRCWFTSIPGFSAAIGRDAVWLDASGYPLCLPVILLPLSDRAILSVFDL